VGQAAPRGGDGAPGLARLTRPVAKPRHGLPDPTASKTPAEDPWARLARMALAGRRSRSALLLALVLGVAPLARAAAAADAGGQTVEIGGVRLWYRVSGRGPVCLLPTPGWGPSSELYFLSLGPLEDLFTVVYAAEFLHRGLPHSDLLVIERAGHFPWMEQPKAFFDGVRAFVLRRRHADGAPAGRDRAP
jgi:pimeloyl-ACP methyl ester carboxylesterase